MGPLFAAHLLPIDHQRNGPTHGQVIFGDRLLFVVHHNLDVTGRQFRVPYNLDAVVAEKVVLVDQLTRSNAARIAFRPVFLSKSDTIDTLVTENLALIVCDHGYIGVPFRNSRRTQCIAERRSPTSHRGSFWIYIAFSELVVERVNVEVLHFSIEYRLQFLKQSQLEEAKTWLAS